MNSRTNLEFAYILLVEFMMLAKRKIFALGAEHGLSGMQAVTLLLLEQPRYMSSFKEILNCDPSNVTGIIDVLENKQLVSRTENRSDRRTKMVELLPKGERLRRELLRDLTSSNSTLFAAFTAQEFAEFMRLVKKITSE
jgi:DNA-binding MarR family transcriptional regulator